MVTQTLSVCACDVFHFMVVFFTAFTVFAMSAWLLYGQELDDFANFARSFHTTFRILIGDFDWDEMTHTGRIQAYVWFWLLQWGMEMIMLNMLLAIIMDVYTEVRNHILAMPHVETLWSQMAEILHREHGVWTGKMVRLSKVLKTLDPTDLESDDDDPIDIL